jgi:hypothetical protein
LKIKDATMGDFIQNFESQVHPHKKRRNRPGPKDFPSAGPLAQAQPLSQCPREDSSFVIFSDDFSL